MASQIYLYCEGPFCEGAGNRYRDENDSTSVEEALEAFKDQCVDGVLHCEQCLEEVAPEQYAAL